jgi:YVTN family beta-propeller protein
MIATMAGRGRARVHRGRVGAVLLTAVSLLAATAAPASAAGWTAYITGGTVAQLNTAANALFGTPISAGATPRGIAITPDGGTAYVSNGGPTVTPIAIATGVAGAAISVGAHPAGIAITPNGTTAYVANSGPGTVTPIATATNTPGAPITTGAGANSVAITPDGTTAYVANIGAATVTPITVATNVAGTPITVGSHPDGIAITPDGRTVYVRNAGDSSVTPIATATNTPETPVMVGTNPAGIGITPDGRTAYVADEVGATVTPIDIATNTAQAPVTVGSTPISVAVTPDGTTAYVVNNDAGTVSPIATATNTAAAAIPIANALQDIAIAPDQPPTAVFAVTAAGAGSPSTFNASGSSSPVGSIARYQWDFGDGQIATTTVPATTHSYAAAGTYTARLTVTNSAGNSGERQVFTGRTVAIQTGPQATTTHAVTVAPAPPPPPSRSAPRLTHVSQTHTTWRAGRRPATAAAARHPRATIGTTYAFTLDQPARVTLSFAKHTTGRSVGGRCVVTTRRNRHRHRCTRTVTSGALTFPRPAGASRVTFQGRLNTRRGLTAGRYTVTLNATGATGLRSTNHALTFTIVA